MITATRFGENAISKRPDFSNPGRPVQEIDPPQKVAEKICEIIHSEVEEIVL